MSRNLRFSLFLNTLVLLVSGPTCFAEDAAEPVRGELILVIGTGGTADFDTHFRDLARRWRDAAALGSLSVMTIGLDESTESTDRQQLEAALSNANSDADRPLWLVLIGHGTFDGRSTKLNLRGPDVTHDEIGSWLQPVTRPVAIIGAHSASGPLIESAGGPRRVVITATKNAAEINFSHFGDYLITALADPTADLDKDDQVSLLEGFLRATRLTRDFYSADGRLETEHPLLDDNHDQRGTRAESFVGTTPLASEGEPTPDGARAHQWKLIPSAHEQQLPPEISQQRDALELQLFDLKNRKAGLTEDEYYRQLEVILLQIAELTLLT